MAKLRIKDICRERGITQKELANKIGITEVGLTKITKGQSKISTLETIANALQVPISTLFEAESNDTILCPHCGKPIYLHPTSTKETETAETANK